MKIFVKVFSKEKKEGIIKKEENRFEIKVKEKPERGLANEGARTALSVFFNIPKARIRLLKGFKTRNKIFEIL